MPTACLAPHQIAYVVFTLFFIVRELKSFIKARLAYFKSFWNLVEIGIIAMSIASIIIFFYRMIVTNGLTKDFKVSLSLFLFLSLSLSIASIIIFFYRIIVTNGLTKDFKVSLSLFLFLSLSKHRYHHHFLL